MAAQWCFPKVDLKAGIELAITELTIQRRGLQRLHTDPGKQLVGCIHPREWQPASPARHRGDTKTNPGEHRDHLVV
jgi:hypothetical protein